MSAKSWPQAAFISAALLLSVPVFVRAQDSSQQTDSVADAARRSREAKQTAKPKKVYTEDDVTRPKPAPASEANPATAQSGTPAATNPDGTPATVTAPAITREQQDAQTEAAWRKRFKDQRDKIARAEKELDILQRETQKALVQYYPDPQKAMNEQYSRKEINDKEAKVEAKRQEIAQLKQGLSDLENELRKAGGDSGWSRE